MVQFGGRWTREKLAILRRYLDEYTTALKYLDFKLIYVDAFAGGGTWRPGSTSYTVDEYGEFRKLHEGSPRIALGIRDRPFDKLVFIDKDPERCRSLAGLQLENPARDIDIRNEDANKDLTSFCDNMGEYDRAVVFLDPYATEVSWHTVAKLAETAKVDCWILFPLSAIARMMPTANEPSTQLALQLDRVFGGREYWYEPVYHLRDQLSFFKNNLEKERAPGSELIADCYRKRLEEIFIKVAPTSRKLLNSKNSPMFELFFAASNRKGASVAIRIADHILNYW